MHPEIAPRMVFERDVIVVGGDERLPTNLRSQRSGQHSADLCCHGPARSVSITTRMGGVVQIFTAFRRLGLEYAKPATYRLCSRQMVIPDRLTQRPRSTVHHEPNAVVLVCLDLSEVISAAEGCELEHAFIVAK